MIRSESCPRASDSERTIQKELTARSNPPVPTKRRKLPFRAGRFVGDLHDLVLAPVVESPFDQARLVECRMVTGRRRRFEEAVDKEHTALRLQRCTHLCPEPFEFNSWYVRKPEAEKHRIKSSLWLPGEEVRHGVLDNT